MALCQEAGQWGQRRACTKAAPLRQGRASGPLPSRDNGAPWKNSLVRGWGGAVTRTEMSSGHPFLPNREPTHVSDHRPPAIGVSSRACHLSVDVTLAQAAARLINTRGTDAWEGEPDRKQVHKIWSCFKYALVTLKLYVYRMYFFIVLIPFQLKYL